MPARRRASAAGPRTRCPRAPRSEPGASSRPRARGLALELRAVADALDLEALLVAVGDALDHVGHQRAGEAVQRAVLAAVGRARDEQLLAAPASTGCRAGCARGARPSGPLTRTCSGSIVTTPRGTGIGCRPMRDMTRPLTRPRARTSPPTPAARPRGRSSRRCEVETIAVPMPPSTFGMCCASTYSRRPGARRARRPEIAGAAVVGVLAGGSRQLARAPSAPAADVVGLDVALLVEDPRELGLQLRGRHLDGLVGGRMRVADAGQEVGDRVGHRHGVSTLLLPRVTQAALLRHTARTWSSPGSGPGARARAGRSGKAELAVHRARAAAALQRVYSRVLYFGGPRLLDPHG